MFIRDMQVNSWVYFSSNKYYIFGSTKTKRTSQTQWVRNVVWFSAADDPKIGENVLGSNFNSFVSNKTLKPGKPWTSKMFQEWLMCCDQSQQNPSMQESHKSTSQLRLSDLQFSFYATPGWLLLTSKTGFTLVCLFITVCVFTCVFQCDLIH